MDTVTAVIRVAHILVGIFWIGLLYFFNLVNVQFVKTLDSATKQKVVPGLMPRALFYFRWAAMLTFIFGVLLLFANAPLYPVPADGPLGYWKSSTHALWIYYGGGFGTIMWFNVWFIIWPAQKKIIAWTRAGESPPEMAVLAKKASFASRLNTWFSLPMLAGMVLSSHGLTLALSGTNILILFIISFVVFWITAKLSLR